MSFEEQELDRRLANLAQIGVIEGVRLSNPPSARVRIGDALTGWFRMGTDRAGPDKTWHPYEDGEEVLAIATSGDLSTGVIVCALYNGTNTAKANSANVHRIDYADGGFIEHDRAAGKLTVNVKGPVDIVAGRTVNIKSPKLTHNGVNVGDTHKHGGIKSGPSKTDVPS